MIGGGNHSPGGQTDRQSRHVGARERGHEAVVGVRRGAERCSRSCPPAAGNAGSADWRAPRWRNTARRNPPACRAPPRTAAACGRTSHRARWKYAIMSARRSRQARPATGCARAAGSPARTSGWSGPRSWLMKKLSFWLGLVALCTCRRALHRGVHRHVADIVLVQPQLQFLLQRQRMEPARRGEAAVDDRPAARRGSARRRTRCSRRHSARPSARRSSAPGSPAKYGP